MISLCLASVSLGVSADDNVLKVFVLAGQSNMEGQAEVNKTCATAEPGKCAAPGAVMNGTLVYQLTDPRTATKFAQCWDTATNNWTVLPSVKIWFNEKGKAAPTPDCPLGCPSALEDGTFGDLSIGFGCGGYENLGARQHIGPEYGAGFALNSALKGEKILLIKTAWGGKTLCGDFLPPSSAANKTLNKTTGFYYTQMLEYVAEILAPENMTKLFPDLSGTPKIVGFGWDQGCTYSCARYCSGNITQQAPLACSPTHPHHSSLSRSRSRSHVRSRSFRE